MNNLEPTVNAVYDVIDERNYNYDEVFWTQKEYPSKFIMDQWEYQNQWIEDITKYMCVYYSTWHWNNEQNIIEWSWVKINCKNFWLLASENNLLDLNAWTKLQNWPDFGIELKYISWYTKVRSLNDIKDSIINKRPIVIGTNKGNWKDAKKTPFILTLGDSYGHAFVIIWYDDNYMWGCIICKNSYWNDWWDNWKFYIKYSDFKEILFYSKYSLTDEINPIINYKQQIMDNINIEKAKDAFIAWIWNGKDASKPVTREECATMVMRALEKLQE